MLAAGCRLANGLRGWWIGRSDVRWGGRRPVTPGPSLTSPNRHARTDALADAPADTAATRPCYHGLTMLQDLDATLAALLQAELSMQNVAISFAPPEDQFPPSGVSLPAIDFFLYD